MRAKDECWGMRRKPCFRSCVFFSCPEIKRWSQWNSIFAQQKKYLLEGWLSVASRNKVMLVARGSTAETL